MLIRKLRNKLLLGAGAISLLMALAYMSAVSWLIREQYLDRSEALLEKSASVIVDNLRERKTAMLMASRQLATQRNFGSTIWYLSQYAHSNLDRETLFSTYLQLARETQKTGHIAKVSRIAIYNASGNLVAFAMFDGKAERAGYVERRPEARFQVAELKVGEEIGDGNLRPAASLAGMAAEFPGAFPRLEDAHYAVVSDLLSIETHVPVIDAVFDQSTGKHEFRQVGLVVMVQPLDQQFVSQLTRLTDTEINVFSTQGFGSGSVASYRKPDWGKEEPAIEPAMPMRLNEITIDDTGYYQGRISLFNDDRYVGSIATLHSKVVVEKNTWEVVRILWLIAAASLLLIIPFAWYFATTISRPLTLLSRIFRGVASHGHAATLGDELAVLGREGRRPGELGDLTRSFLAMNDAVNQKIGQINEINASLENIVSERTAALVAREAESRTLIDNSPDSIARYDRECRRIYANPAFVAMAGCRLDELLGKRPAEHPAGPDAEVYETKLQEVLASGENAQFELKWAGRDGQERCSHVRLTAEIDQAGKVVSVLAVGRDISERMVFEETIWKQANFDALTHLPNRHMFHDRLEQEARISHRSGTPMALMLIDLDHFKEVNDTLGHDKGDLLLVQAAQRIKSCVRESDTVARLGGDEFTVILSQLDDLDSIERIAQNIIRKLGEPFAIGSNEAFISASIGITLYPGDSSELDVLFKNADQAMYVAKSAGRNRFSYFTPDLQERAQSRLQLANDLRAALAGNQFVVHYQPIIELPSGAIHKAEALIRWQHPERGLISPVDFVPLAEETGLIVPIGDWLFKEAVRQARVWRERYDASFQISVNKSPVQIRYEDISFVSWPDYLQAQGMPGQSIVVEITEGLLLNAEAKINEKLLKFRDAGIQVAIDDFGTGYSSLSYLKRFDIDYLKIDQSFVQSLGSDADDLALCEAMIVMAHKLGLRVIAEGVETVVQRDLLAAAGCDFVQGFLYSRPVAAAAFEKLLSAA